MVRRPMVWSVLALDRAHCSAICLQPSMVLIERSVAQWPNGKYSSAHRYNGARSQRIERPSECMHSVSRRPSSRPTRTGPLPWSSVSIARMLSCALLRARLLSCARTERVCCDLLCTCLRALFRVQRYFPVSAQRFPVTFEAIIIARQTPPMHLPNLLGHFARRKSMHASPET